MGQEGKRNETFSPTDCRLVFNQLVTEQVGLFFFFPPSAGSNYEARNTDHTATNKQEHDT